MNLLQLAQRLHRESGRSGAGPTSVTGATKEDRRLFDWIGDKWLELQSRANIEWRWMRRSAEGDTTTSQLAYSGPDLGLSDFGRWRAWSDDEYTVRAYLTSAPTQVWGLEWMPFEQFRRRYMDGATDTGQPLNWSVSDDDELLIGPLSDQVYRLKFDYITEPSLLEDDEDEPEMPSRHHLLLVWAGLVEVGTYDNAPDVLARASRNYARMEHTLMADQVRQITLGGPLV